MTLTVGEGGQCQIKPCIKVSPIASLLSFGTTFAYIVKNQVLYSI